MLLETSSFQNVFSNNENERKYLTYFRPRHSNATDISSTISQSSTGRRRFPREGRILRFVELESHVSRHNY